MISICTLKGSSLQLLVRQTKPVIHSFVTLPIVQKPFSSMEKPLILFLWRNL